jgi:hypothetical protein
MWRNHIYAKEACFKPSDKTTLLPLFCLHNRRLGQELGSAHIRDVLFIKAQRLGELKRMFRVVFSAYNMKGGDKSPDRLLLLYGATYFERDYEEEKVDSGVPKYNISYSSSASL